MAKKKKNDNFMVAEALVMILQFGINMIVPILLCTMVGVWIGNRTGASWAAIPLFFIGALAGGNNIYRMAKRLIEPDRYHSGPKTDTKTDIKKEAGNVKKTQ